MVDNAAGKAYMTPSLDPQLKFAKYLKRTLKSYSDLRYSMGECARIVKRLSERNFELKGYGKYVPLTEPYQRRKIKKAGRKVPILVGVKPQGGVSGKLRDSIVGTTRDSVLRVNKQSFEVGTAAKSDKGYLYPAVIQLGTEKSDKIPPRPYLFLTPTMVKLMMNVVEKELVMLWGKGGSE